MESSKLSAKFFFDRPEITTQLLKRINALKNQYRQNIALIGQKSLGKTTLIFELLKRCQGNDIIPIYVEVQPKSPELFANKFIGVMLTQYLNLDRESNTDNFENLLEKSKHGIPATVRAINHINKLIRMHGVNDEIFALLLDLPQTLHDETKKPILLIFDEFHNLESFTLTNPFLVLSNKIMVQKHTMYIIISSTVYIAQKIIAEKLSLLFGNFEVIKITPLNNESAKKFIELKMHNLNINEILQNFLISFSGGYPFYLDVLTDQIKNLCFANDVKSVTEKILLAAITETLYQEYGILNQFFQNQYHQLLTNKQTNTCCDILTALANGHKKPTQISTALAKKVTDINRHLNKLLQLDLVLKKGVFNYIQDPLFNFWLKLVLSRRQNTFEIDEQKLNYNFELDIKQNFDRYFRESQKDVGLRLKELFEKFENDIIELDKKKFKLTRFDEIDIKDNNQTNIIHARKSNKYWHCYITENHIDENRVGELSASLKKSRKEFAKKILVALDGIDVNARLKALQERFWIWDQGVINELFSLYDKPRYIK